MAGRGSTAVSRSGANGAAPPAERWGDREYLGILARAAVLGPAATAGVLAFVLVLHEVTGLLWHHVPGLLGAAAPPSWWILAVLVAGGALTAAALRLPGGGGHPPLGGLGFDLGPRAVLSVLAASLASLAFGAVLGPEAPALAIGTALGALAAQALGRGDPEAVARRRPLLMVAGGAAAFGAVLGNPLALALFVLEAALLGRGFGGTARSLAPVAVTLATGFVLLVGFGAWAGLGEVVLSVPGLAAYPDVVPADLAVAVPLCVVVAVVIRVALRGGGLVQGWSRRVPPIAALTAAGATVAVLAIGARAVADVPVDLVLFSGQSALAGLLTTTAIPVVLVALLTKTVAFAVCLGAGFRGGSVFPAVFLGAALAVVASLLVPAATAPGLVAAGVAAGTAAVLRAPFSAALLAVLLTAGAGVAVTTPALIGACVALLATLAFDRRSSERHRDMAAVPPAVD